MKLTKKKLIAIIAVICILAAAFILQGTAGKHDAGSISDSAMSSDGLTDASGEKNDADISAEDDSESPKVEKEDTSVPDESADNKKEDAEADEPDSAESEAEKADTAVAPPEKETPTEPEEKPAPELEEKKLTCTLYINCSTILNNMELLTPGKEGIIPSDGYLLYVSDAEFTKGESVFDVFQRELKSRNIHFEFSNSALYDTAYIEGIGNIYEFDCGELSGWEYSVNGVFPGYGCSKYTLSDGDTVAFLYTCDLGKDVGNYH